MRGNVLVRFFLTFALGNSCLPIVKVLAEDLVVHIGDVAEITLPPGAFLQQSVQKMPDFTVYYVKDQHINLLGIYVGNAPDADLKGLQTRSYFGRCAGRLSKYTSKSGVNLDAVVETNAKYFPKFIHLFYRGLSIEEAALVDEIVKSLRFQEGHGCGVG